MSRFGLLAAPVTFSVIVPAPVRNEKWSSSVWRSMMPPPLTLVLFVTTSGVADAAVFPWSSGRNVNP